MKQVLGCLVTFALLLCFCLYHLARLETLVTHTCTLLDTALEANTKQAAANAAQEASNYWNEAQSYLGFVLRHDQLDRVAEELALLQSYAQSEDEDDFQSHCLSLRTTLHHILQMELPLLENLL